MGGLARTYYQQPWRDRWTAHTTVEWTDAAGTLQQVRVHNRLTDFEGRLPSLLSCACLPWIAWTRVLAKARKIVPAPIPFLSMGAVMWLARRVQPGCRVLEWGGGNSTLWFLGRGAEVVTIESSPEWSREIEDEARKRNVATRLNLQNLSGSAALDFAAGLGRDFDFVLVDCAQAETSRQEAMHASWSKVRRGGWMILDNSDHPHHWEAVREMSPHPGVHFTGYGPMSLVVTRTSLWQNQEG